MGKEMQKKKRSVKYSIYQHADPMTIYEVRHGSTEDQMKDVVKAYYCHNVEKDMHVHDIF